MTGAAKAEQPKLAQLQTLGDELQRRLRVGVGQFHCTLGRCELSRHTLPRAIDEASAVGIEGRAVSGYGRVFFTFSPSLLTLLL